MINSLAANSHNPEDDFMAASVSTSEAAKTLATRGQRRSTTPQRDTNKRPRMASEGELEMQHKKKTETASCPGVFGSQEMWGNKTEEKNQFPIDVEDEGGGEAPDVSAEIAAVAAKNKQLQVSVASLKRKFSLREDETHQLLLGLGALNAVANELSALQKDYQERSTKNAALIQQSLVQISNCSAQVDTLKRCRGLTTTQLQGFRHECTQEMNRLVFRLGELAESSCQEPEPFDGDDVSCADVRMLENRQQVQRLQDDVCGYRAQLIEDGSAASCHSTSGPTQQDTTDRINQALAQLDELHAEMFQLKQNLEQENVSFRRHLENLVSRQMAQIREVQDNETERIHEEMDEIRSGTCGILKDIHRLKERTKYLVPSMARVGFTNSGDQKEDRWTAAPQSSSNPRSSGYSMTMAARQCRDEFPHLEHGFNDDCYCPGILAGRMAARYARPGHPRSSKSSISSPGRSDDENWRMFPAEDAAATVQDVAQPCESPHYSSRSSNLTGCLSAYGEDDEKPTGDQFDRRLLEQHRLFWIGEGAG